MGLENLYRWCDDYGGGVVIASSKEEAIKKLTEKYGDERRSFIVWSWTNDDGFDEGNKDVLDIY